MFHKLLAGALAALLLSAAMPLSSLTAQTTPSVDGPTVPDCLTGKAAGAWDLPTGSEAGRMRGHLIDVSGVRFALDARLTPALIGDKRGGRIDGVLYVVTKGVRARSPFAAVQGTYVVGSDRRGQFETAIVGLDPTTTVRPTLVGKLAGEFADPEIPGQLTVGRFAGRWAICR